MKCIDINTFLNFAKIVKKYNKYIHVYRVRVNKKDYMVIMFEDNNLDVGYIENTNYVVAKNDEFILGYIYFKVKREKMFGKEKVNNLNGYRNVAKIYIPNNFYDYFRLSLLSNTIFYNKEIEKVLKRKAKESYKGLSSSFVKYLKIAEKV
ncbi:MAG: hypothetical protein QXW35_04645 [Candidatus Aenigmatarchaeota archaeon]